MNDQISNPIAFPCNTENSSNPGAACMELGMSLRDYFAAAALQGMTAALHPGLPIAEDCRHYAKCAYMQADAMLRERRNNANS